MDDSADNNEFDDLRRVFQEILDTIGIILSAGPELFDKELYDSEMESLVNAAWEQQHESVRQLIAGLEQEWQSNQIFRDNIRFVGLVGAPGKAKSGLLRKIKEWIKARGPKLLEHIKKFFSISKSILKSLDKVLTDNPALGLIAEGIGELLDLIKTLLPEKKD